VQRLATMVVHWFPPNFSRPQTNEAQRAVICVIDVDR
jgi:hypothetical protein